MKRSIPAAILVLALAGCSGAGGVRTPSLMNASQPVPGIVTAGRLQAADVPELRSRGFREVIDLTRDEETPGFDEAAVVRANGMRYVNLPIHGKADLTQQNVRAFDALLQQSEHPVVVHCASSNRVGAMAALRAGWLQGQSTEAAIAEGKRWGLKGLEPEVRALLENRDAAGPEAAPKH